MYAGRLGEGVLSDQQPQEQRVMITGVDGLAVSVTVRHLIDALSVWMGSDEWNEFVSTFVVSEATAILAKRQGNQPNGEEPNR